MTWDFQECGMCDQQSLGPACTYVQSDQSLCKSLEYSISVKLTEHHLEFLGIKGSCTCSSESTLVTCHGCYILSSSSVFLIALALLLPIPQFYVILLDKSTRACAYPLLSLNVASLIFTFFTIGKGFFPFYKGTCPGPLIQCKSE